MADTTIRLRFGTSRARTGCITCKARHVKCDEGRPDCQRCRKAKRPCEGYPDDPQRGRSPRRELVVVNYVATPPHSVSANPDTDWRELRALHYFETRTAPELSGAFPTDFWSHFMLRFSQYESSVRYALVAIGSIHEYYSSFANSTWDQLGYAMQQYGKAIQQALKLHVSSADHAVETALLTCILFSSFESLNAHYQSSLSHIMSGMKLLTGEGSRTENNSEIPYQTIHQIFRRMESQIIEIGNITLRPSFDTMDIILEPPTFFSTIDEALASYENFYNHQLRFTFYADPILAHPESHPDILPRIQKTKTFFRGYLNSWCSAFNRLLAAKPPDVPEPINLESLSVLALRICQQSLQIMLDYDNTEGECGYDASEDRFSEVVSLAEEFVKKSSTLISPPSNLRVPSHSAPSPLDLNQPFGANIQARDRYKQLLPKSAQVIQPTFSMSLGIIPHLYLTAARCRDPKIRKRALRLLQVYNRREGVWDSDITAMVAEKFIKTEEAAAIVHMRFAKPEGPWVIQSASQVPKKARINVLDTSFDSGTTGKIKFNTTVPEIDGKRMEFAKYIDVLEWGSTLENKIHN